MIVYMNGIMQLCLHKLSKRCDSSYQCVITGCILVRGLGGEVGGSLLSVCDSHTVDTLLLCVTLLQSDIFRQSRD